MAEQRQDGLEAQINESEPRSVTFRDLVERDTAGRLRNPAEKDCIPQNIFYFSWVGQKDNPAPTLGVSFSPAFVYGRPGNLLGSYLYHTNDSERETLIVGQSIVNEEIMIVDGKGRAIDPAKVIVAASQAEAEKIGSWIVDPEIRKLIQDQVK
jgi:hypothetical protein